MSLRNRSAAARPARETEEASRKLVQMIPYARIGVPEDVARVVVRLASDLSDYFTGATVYVDGGQGCIRMACCISSMLWI